MLYLVCMCSCTVISFIVKPHATTGVPPCTLILNRTLCTQLDLLTPRIGARVKDNQTQQKQYSDDHHKERKLSIGQTTQKALYIYIFYPMRMWKGVCGRDGEDSQSENDRTQTSGWEQRP